MDFPSPARKHLAHRRWRKLPVSCFLLCSCSSRSISSEEVTGMVGWRNETEERVRSLRSWSPVLGCLLWVTLLEQGLGQGDQPPGLPPSLTHPGLFLLLVSSHLLQRLQAVGLCFVANSVLLSCSVSMWLQVLTV